MNAKVRRDLYKLKNIPEVKNAMIIGVDVVNEGRQSIMTFCASYNEDLTQYHSKVNIHELRRDKPTKDEQETELAQERVVFLSNMLVEALDHYKTSNKGRLPA